MAKKGRPARHQADAGGAYVGGDVHTEGGDFVGRDKIAAGERSVIMRGPASGNVISTGDSAVIGVRQEASLEGFVRLLAELRQGLPQAGLDQDTVQVVEGDVKVAEEQAQKPKPNGAIILAKLESVTKLLTTAVTASEAAQKLVPVAHKAVQWAGALFH